MNPRNLLAELESIRARFGEGHGPRKAQLLAELREASLPTAALVGRLHDAACFLRACPDDEAVRAAAHALLTGFAGRRDLKRFRRALADTGIAGTETLYPYFGPTARWLAQRFPGKLHVYWDNVDEDGPLEERLQLLASWSETPGLDEVAWPMRTWVKRLAGPDLTDAEWLLQRCARVGRDQRASDQLYEELGLELNLLPGEDTPARTHELLPVRKVHHHVAPLRHDRPDLAAMLKVRLRERRLTGTEATRVVTLARECMIARQRDLDAFAHGDPDDVRLFECEDGIAFAVIGVQPAYRLQLESVYAFLTLRNGVPIGYVLTSGLMGSTEIAYNVFDAWRGAEAARLYGLVVAVAHQLYGSDTFTVYPYQLGGDGNDEGLASGAWWFYQKLGFRARDPKVLRLMERELGRMARDPKHRSSIATLKQLATANVYWSKGAQREDVIGIFPLEAIGVATTDLLARRFGADRERGEATCAAELAALCGARDWKRWPAAERLWWLRWAPMLCAIPALPRWPVAARRNLVAVVRAKGGRCEADFVRRFDRHALLRKGLKDLAASVQGL
ncbi:MAG: hypothetical protein RIT25_1862 [Planctomycetota bacterium]